ncbi:membrane lipoprotein lipid attachment site-containing protein [Mesotoga sp. BH458_6_3_2_1]|uniref:membrane lipoprotein lipid attachment site-containing protein n=1 Tax=Mesotoga sp. BH458_6_3_2_1 TaxID=1437446 RepID=UPI000EF28792|nr:membrane lipoprotein lipid attachment site-containing protein [Mesotoga sp. BH458_6_3_2_1]RLL87085.1 hypothetical protein Y697_01895 [Mesotoga sp. BH458_6_3_2_1]
MKRILLLLVVGIVFLLSGCIFKSNPAGFVEIAGTWSLNGRVVYGETDLTGSGTLYITKQDGSTFSGTGWYFVLSAPVEGTVSERPENYLVMHATVTYGGQERTVYFVGHVKEFESEISVEDGEIFLDNLTKKVGTWTGERTVAP